MTLPHLTSDHRASFAGYHQPHLDASSADITRDDRLRRHDIHFRRTDAAAGLDDDSDLDVVFDASTTSIHSWREPSASSPQVGRGVTTTNAI